MASRKQQKEEARQRRLEQERTQALQARKRRRMQMLGGVLVGAVAVVAVAIAISAGGSNGSTPLKHGTEASQTYSQVNQLLTGIPQSGTTLGKPSAKVTIDYYGDLECPDCKAFTLGQGEGGLPQFISKDVRQGKAKIVYKSFCTATCGSHPKSIFNMQQVAAYAAGKQNLFWDYAELFYREQGDETTDYVTPAYLDGLAKQIPSLKLSTWQTDQKDPSLLAQVQADEQQANQLGLPGTPALVAIGPKGETEVQDGSYGLPTYSTMESAVSKVA
jgi:protein-disulfide isomerase